MSGILMVVAPAWTATSQILTRKSGSVRVASSAENSTSSAEGPGERDRCRRSGRGPPRV